MIQTLETTKNDYVRGVPRSMIRLVVDPVHYGKLRTYLDKGTNNANVDTAAEDFSLFLSLIHISGATPIEIFHEYSNYVNFIGRQAAKFSQ